MLAISIGLDSFLLQYNPMHFEFLLKVRRTNGHDAQSVQDLTVP